MVDIMGKRYGYFYVGSIITPLFAYKRKFNAVITITLNPTRYIVCSRRRMRS